MQFLKYSWSIWKGLNGWAKGGIIVALLVVLGVAGGGDGGEEQANQQASNVTPAQEQAAPVPTPEQPQDPNVNASFRQLARDSYGVFKTSKDSAVLTGNVEPLPSGPLHWQLRKAPGASVIDKGTVKVDTDGHFRLKVDGLKTGEQRIIVAARANVERALADETAASVPIIRTLTAAERAAIRERKRQQREAARQRRIQLAAQREANFKAQAITIDYDQLQKNPDAHAGKKVKYYGEIFQIQESGFGEGGLMLLSVTDEGYGFWTDQVWVNYEGKVEGAEDDFVTVYGVVKGSKSYETQIGGERYVPEIDARYIEE